MHTCRTQLSQIIASRPVAPPTPQADGGGGGGGQRGSPPPAPKSQAGLGGHRSPRSEGGEHAWLSGESSRRRPPPPQPN